MTQDLSHLNQQGEVHMVDVGDRPTTHRVQKLSRITHSIQQMARELNVPVIALS